MRTNIELDELLLKRAGRHLPKATKRKIVDTALREFVEQRERASLRDFFGSQLIAPEYDYKSARR
jgi:Arc/MetJ family transcription regulator